jgi:DNA-binding NtrC family response regulator
MTINAPSLADHPEDIPELAQFFVKLYAEQYNKYMTGIAQEVLALFQGYVWPGNVRELENVIQSSIIRADLPVIQVLDLPDRFREVEPADGDLPQNGTFEMLLRDFKLKVALKAIEDCNGNKTLAARSLNISRAYLHRLIRPNETVESIDAA